MGFEKLSENLYCYHDTCEVYLVKRGSNAVAIDFGDGAVLEHLGEIGVTQLDAILHTHHHRDQCQGAAKANALGIPIYVPESERCFFDDVENFWRNRHVYDIYNVRNTFFSLTKSVQVTGVLEDYETFRWRETDFEILATPGHTMGSITLIATIDGVRVAFTGDLLHSPGQVQTLYDLQHEYGAGDGMDQAILSLNELGRRGADLLCPSHGTPMREPGEALRRTEQNLSALYTLYTRETPTAHQNIQAITPQVLSVTHSCSNFYVLLAKSGKALFIDYGTPSFPFLLPNLKHEGEGQQRFVLHDLAQLRSRFGMKSVDVAIPSHYHDDHVCGFPYLQRHEGTQVWSYKNMVDILEKPHTEKVGCIYHDPIRVDRAIGDGERIRWEEFDFEVHYAPGHCDYHMAMFLESEGKRIALTGDNIFNFEGHHQHQLEFNVVFQNITKKDDHQKTARKVLDFEPHIICPGHRGHFEVTRASLEQFLEDVTQLTRHYETLIADPDTNVGLDSSWVRVVPYQAPCKPGGTVAAEIRIRNLRSRAIRCELELVLQEGWEATPSKMVMSVEPGAEVATPFELRVGSWPDAPVHKAAYAVDVTVDGTRLGQIAEGLVVSPSVVKRPHWEKGEQG